ncbi:MAG: hypothetical protein QOI24_3167 [Acidobacteriota bacterium]|jgi:hypothetical protein|nr:hypothetical protein [Acidobacteriota bacterium]
MRTEFQWRRVLQTCAIILVASITRVYGGEWQVATQGNDIVVTVGSGLSGKQCCRGASIDYPSLGASCSQACPANPVITQRFSCNAVGTHTVYAFWSDDKTNGSYVVETKTIDVTDPPAPNCPQFDLVVRSTKVLTHKFGASLGAAAVYPNGQTTDGELPITLVTRAAAPGTQIYLRVVDPEDAAAYSKPPQKNDNVDTGRGTISGARTATVTLPQTGGVDVILQTSLNASGDNYQVQASANPSIQTDPSFVCDWTTFCQSSGNITAWKRLYVEMDEMYRTSSLVGERSLVGATTIYTDGSFSRGNNVRMIHAPSFGRADAADTAGFYSEDRVILNVAKNSNPAHKGKYAITLDKALTQPYYLDIVVLNTQLGDAIVNLSQNADPLYHFDPQYVAGAFAEAFVEVITSPTGGVGVPFYAAMNDGSMAAVGNKWFAAKTGPSTPSNFGLAIAASTRASLTTPNALSLGTTGGIFSYVWRQTIDTATAGPKSKYPLTSGLNATTVSGEVLVHELAHQWNVNTGYPGNECDKKSYANAVNYCHGNGPQNSGQYGDGIIKFHYVGSSPANADSEYMTIRKAADPR